MKTPKFLLGILVVLSALLLFPSSKSEAAEFHFKQYKLEQGKTVTDDLYIFASDAKIEGIVDGDLIIFAENIDVTGTVTGDVYLGGSKINIDSIMYGDLFLLGSNITVDGLVNGNMYALANNLNSLGQTAKDILALAYQSTFKGTIGDDLRVLSFSPSVDASISGDLLISGEKVTVAEKRVIGKIYYNKTIEEIAKGQGVDLNKDKNDDTLSKLFRGNTFLTSTVKGFFSFLTMLLAGCFLLWLTPVKNAQIKRKITDTPIEFVKSLLIGLCTFLVVPIPLLILLVSIIGAPVALIVIAFLLFVSIFGKIWVELAIGSELLSLLGVKGYRPYRSFLVGRIISVLIGLIPVISGFYGIVLTLTSLGAIIRMKRDFFMIAKQDSELPTVKESKIKRIPKKRVSTKKI